MSDPNEPTEGESPDLLTDELARKYDPERMLRMVSRRAGKGERLDHSIRSKYEQRFGVDLGHVRIYTGEFAEEFNKQRGAYAVTIGSTGMILMGGSPDKSMGSASGQALLAHELTHVAQAQRGVFRDASDQPLATGEHEAEAAQTQAEVRQGGAGGNSAEADIESGKKQEQLKKMVFERVLDMFAEGGRLMLLRGGPFQRRA